MSFSSTSVRLGARRDQDHFGAAALAAPGHEPGKVKAALLPEPDAELIVESVATGFLAKSELSARGRPDPRPHAVNGLPAGSVLPRGRSVDGLLIREPAGSHPLRVVTRYGRTGPRTLQLTAQAVRRRGQDLRDGDERAEEAGAEKSASGSRPDCSKRESSQSG